MNPLSLRLKNVGRFADLDIDLPEGLLAVVGSNGSGKSTLVGAIELALFADGSRDLAGCLSPWADRLEIEFVFSHAGDTYRVRRGYVGGARGKATLDLEILADPAWTGEKSVTWQAISRENTAATQAHLCDILGLSRAAFNASAFLSQGNSAAFPEATASERKALLGTILDPHGFWPKVALQATAERRDAEASILVNQGRIADGEERVSALATFRQELSAVSEDADDATAKVTALEGDVATAQAALAEAQAAAERVRTLTAERDAAKQESFRASSDYDDATVAKGRMHDFGVELIALPESGSVAKLEAKVEEQRRLTEARRESLNRIAVLQGDHKRLLMEIEVVAQEGVASKKRHADLTLQADELENHPHEEHACEVCGQTLPDDARQKVIGGLRLPATASLDRAKDALEEVERLEQRGVDLGNEIEAVQIPEVPSDDFAGQLTQARKTETRRIELGVLIQGYEEKAARLDELREAHEISQLDLMSKSAALQSVSTLVPDMDRLLGIFHGHEEQLHDARTSLAEIQQRQARLEQQIETLTQLATKVEVMQAEVADKQKQIDLLKLAERAFGRDGIPALIVESVIGVIEAETNRLLEKMPTSDGETFRVELRTQRALKTADHLKETLDIVVYDRDGERPYETYSGGEQARLNICLRIALALLLADRRGAESRLLVCDELEYLDSLGQEQLIDVIQSVSNRFDRTIVVSHHRGIRDAFDNTLRIVKDDGVSRVLSDGESNVAV